MSNLSALTRSSEGLHAATIVGTHAHHSVAHSQKSHGQYAGLHRQRLRLLSYNIQAGITTSHYRHYVTRSWQHVLPDAQRIRNLDRIAHQIGQFDLVALQEADGGSFRSGFINQIKYLSEKAKFPFWYQQTNRNLGSFAQHSNGLLSRVQPYEVEEYRLPGLPGRGVMAAFYGLEPQPLVVVIFHLALSRRARIRQLSFISELIREYRHVVLMGDWNCDTSSIEMTSLLRNAALREPINGLNTFPSWRPRRNIDHILVTPTLGVESAHVLKHSISDHLPITMEVVLPDECVLGEPSSAK